MAQLMPLPLTVTFASVKSRLVLPFWYRLTRVVPDKGPLNGCVCAGAPKISVEPRYRDAQKIKGGTRMKLEATVTGCPAPSVAWHLDGKPLVSAGATVVRRDDATGLSTLEVDDASRLTAGRYRVTAENSLGRAAADFDVAVTGQSVDVEKVKAADTRLPSVGFRSWSRFLAVT